MKKIYTLTLSSSLFFLTACGGGGLTPNINIPDIFPPVISLHGENPLTIKVGDVYQEAGASAIDGVDGIVQVEVSGAVNAGVIGTYPIVYTAIDAAANKIQVLRIVNVVDKSDALDTTAPVITLKGSNPLAIEVGKVYEEAGASAVDDRDGNIPVIINGTVDVSSVGTYSIIYTVTDKAGNTANKTRIVNVKASLVDEVAPTITVKGDNPMTIEVGSTYVEAGASAEDDKDGNVSVTTSGAVDTNSIGIYSIVYTATDEAGNVATEPRKVIVVEKLDTVAPVITLQGDNPLTIKLGDAYQEPGATAIDARDGIVDAIPSGTVNINSVGEYEIVYTALDVAGNTSQTTRIVNVALDVDSNAYKYVTAADVGVTIGVGVLGDTPTDVYTGSKNITSPTLIENKVIEGCLTINSDDVTVRNSIVNCDGWFGVLMNQEYSNFNMEYSSVTCTAVKQGSKVFNLKGPNHSISNNDVKGCEDFFYINGNIDGLEIKNNYLHDTEGTIKAHADALQIGEIKDYLTTGKMHVQGNNFSPNTNIPMTALIFATHHSAVDILFEDNYVTPYGAHSLRCTNTTKCTIKNNVFSDEFVTQWDDKILYSPSSEPTVFSCNRYANGNFVEKYVDGKDVLGGVEHITTNCDDGDTPVNNGLQKRNLKEIPEQDRFTRPLDKVWPAQANEIDITLWKDDKFAAVSITIDDNIINDHDFWTQASQQYGWKFTWFIITDELNKGSTTYGAWSDFQTMFNSGHDIESHTITHRKIIEMQSEDEIVIEYRDSLKQINQNITGNDAQTIAYPDGQKGFSRDIASQFAIAGRGTASGVNKPERTDYLKINSISDTLGNDYLDAILKGTSGISWMGDNKYKRGWFLSHFHLVKNKTEIENGLDNLNQRSGDLWIGKFKEVAMYGQERDTATIEVISNDTTKLTFKLRDDMDDMLFQQPLTLKIKLHSFWNTVKATQNGKTINTTIVTHENEKYVLIQAIPDKGLIELMP